MTSLVLAADAQSGADAGDTAGPREVLMPEAAGRKGDPQWHAGDDPPPEEACSSWPLHQSEQLCYDRSEDLHCDAETW